MNKGYHNKTIISLAAIKYNVAAILGQLKPGTQLLAVVKANGYGHGGFAVAKAALEQGATWLGVARATEGMELRNQGIKAPILVLGACLEDECQIGVEYDLTMALTHLKQLEWIEAACKNQQKTAAVHMKIDTGMNRIGVKTTAEARALWQQMENSPFICLTGAFTHFACPEKSFVQRALQQFLTITKQALPPNILLHAASSGTLLRYPESHLDMVRSGITLYGYPPVETSLVFKRAMRWQTSIIYIKQIDKGEKVGYGGIFTTDKPMKIATVAVGYGDGYSRALIDKAQVLIGGLRAKVVGKICMDQIMVDISGINAEIGDEVVLLGKQQNQEITAAEIAQWADTVSYDVLLSPTIRVMKEYE